MNPLGPRNGDHWNVNPWNKLPCSLFFFDITEDIIIPPLGDLQCIAADWTDVRLPYRYDSIIRYWLLASFFFFSRLQGHPEKGAVLLQLSGHPTSHFQPRPACHASSFLVLRGPPLSASPDLRHFFAPLLPFQFSARLTSITSSSSLGDTCCFTIDIYIA